MINRGPSIVDDGFKLAEALERRVEKPLDPVGPSHVARWSGSLPLLQVFQDRLLFLTFLPGPSRGQLRAITVLIRAWVIVSRGFQQSAPSTWHNVGDRCLNLGKYLKS